MLIADGDPNAVVLTNLFDYRNTVAVAFKGNADIGSNGNTFMMEFQAAKSYVLNSTTNASCTITQNFGGFLCDQAGKAKDLFNAINSVRMDPNPETNFWFGTQIKKWQSGFQTSNTGGTSQIPMTLTDPDTGTNSIVNTSEGKPCVDGAIT